MLNSVNNYEDWMRFVLWAIALWIQFISLKYKIQFHPVFVIRSYKTVTIMRYLNLFTHRGVK